MSQELLLSKSYKTFQLSDRRQERLTELSDKTIKTINFSNPEEISKARSSITSMGLFDYLGDIICNGGQKSKALEALATIHLYTAAKNWAEHNGYQQPQGLQKSDYDAATVVLIEQLNDAGLQVFVPKASDLQLADSSQCFETKPQTGCIETDKLLALRLSKMATGLLCEKIAYMRSSAMRMTDTENKNSDNVELTKDNIELTKKAISYYLEGAKEYKEKAAAPLNKAMSDHFRKQEARCYEKAAWAEENIRNKFEINPWDHNERYTSANEKNFISKIKANDTLTSKSDIACLFLNAVNIFSASDGGKEAMKELTESLGKINVAPGKLKLELDFNFKGEVRLLLRALYPESSENIQIKTFDGNLSSYEQGGVDESQLQHLREIKDTCKEFNISQGIDNQSKNYLDCILDNFSIIGERNENIAKNRPIYINMLGSGDSGEKGQLKDYHAFFHHQNQVGADKCLVIDGPSKYTGEKFDRNVAQGLGHVLKQVSDDKCGHVVLTGHSRGACEAILVNNILVQAFNDKDAAKMMIPKSIQGKSRKELTDLIDNLPADRKIDITLNLFDPVKGPFEHTGFSSINQLLIKDPQHKVNYIKCVNEHKRFFDMHLPKFKMIDESDVPSPSVNFFSINSMHGKVIRAPKIFEKGKGQGSYEGYAFTCRLLGIKNNFTDSLYIQQQSKIDKTLLKVNGNTRFNESFSPISYDQH